MFFHQLGQDLFKRNAVQGIIGLFICHVIQPLFKFIYWLAEKRIILPGDIIYIVRIKLCLCFDSIISED